MITGIEIKRLRGIHEGKLTDLTPLTVLVGPSGAGKSTLLDALLIGASGSPGDAVGHVIHRRAGLPAGAPWLFEKASEPGATAMIHVIGDPLYERSCEIRLRPDPDRHHTPIEVHVQSRELGQFVAWTMLSRDNRYDFGLNTSAGPSNADRIDAFATATRVQLIEVDASASHESLTRVFSRVMQKGGTATIRQTISSILEGAQDVRLLTYDDGDHEQPILHVDMRDYTVPLAAAGSGIYSVMRLALELAGLPDHSVALVEEPEIHQHPSVIHHAAGLLLAAARRGVQVVVSTHSLELVDSLASLAKSDSDLLSVVRVVLDHGELRSSHFSQEMVATARGEADEDLR